MSTPDLAAHRRAAARLSAFSEEHLFAPTNYHAGSRPQAIPESEWDGPGYYLEADEPIYLGGNQLDALIALKAKKAGGDEAVSTVHRKARNKRWGRLARQGVELLQTGADLLDTLRGDD